ncbi:hypothetical protein BJ138DRAFT_415120 [Hygrophoropsis aurantiaca]|uniref:Uncharacterized protein n=1 Tax=Hygrophoropsis aurantiaca TaxID=72124 RepID=A0ACB8ALP4_9AGAM|nr:hypothetical protein BJ138DRAFT_415120 [Hygrophoropsis aurantiaca]
MHPSQNRSRRKRGKAANDDDGSLLVSRMDETSSDTHTRPHSHTHQQTDSYRPSSSSRSYNMNRDGSSSHHDDHYHPSTSDTYHRGTRDDYDVSDSREGDSWVPPRSSNDSHYQPGREWSGGRDQSYSASAHNEPNSWVASNSYGNTPHGRNWHADDRRDNHPDDRQGWDRRDKDRRSRGTQNWQRDNGWDSRRRDHNQSGAESLAPISGPEDGHFSRKDDRSWEPGPTWQTSGDDQGNRSQRSGRNHGSNRNSKGGKKGQNQHKNRRDRDGWRERDRIPDESNLNNWQRRDISSLPPKPTFSPAKQRAVWSRSQSRSRSRSPESIYSRHSSRGRSHSRSLSPRPAQRHLSPGLPFSRTPSDRGRSEWQRRGRRDRSRSPASSLRSRPSPVGARRRSLSSASSSSMSRSRSSSRSPEHRPKPKHRLPPATSIREISLSISKTSLQQRSNMLGSREGDPRHPERLQANGKHPNQRRQWSPGAQRNATERMPPPPTTLPSTTSSKPLSPTVSLSSAGRTEPSSSKAIGSIKPIAFKPIGKASSSVKRFFPQDDDDNSDNSITDNDHLKASPIESQHTHNEAILNHVAVLHSSKAVSVERPDIRPKRTHDEIVSDRDDQYPAEEGAKVSSLLKSPIPRRPDPPFEHRNPSTASDQVSRAPSPIQSKPSTPKPSKNEEITPAPQVPIVESGSNGITRPSSPVSLPRKELYAIVSQVGEGTFGKVYKARNTVTNVHVALKRIRMEAERDGFPVTAMREIKLLQSLRHQNVVRLYEMMVSSGSVHMVFEYMDHDLTGVLSQTQFSFSEANLKSLCGQMLAGLAYLHHKGVIHRDIKGSNILINNRGELKLADFGLARFYHKRRRTDYTNRVITLWYRPPELLFGATVYGPEVDMWSAGCIMLELYTKKPIFQGNDEIHQLDVIYRIIGTPTTDRWSGVSELPWYELIKPKETIPDHFRELFQKWLSPAALDLAEQLLAYDPTRRITAVQALETPYFKDEKPLPEMPTGLSTLEGEWHELETKRERAKKRRKLETVM